MDYAKLSLDDVIGGLTDLAAQAGSTFGSLSHAQLNWRTERSRWSVGQCFHHLVIANALMLDRADAALANPPDTFPERVSMWPRLLGPMMIRSQAPGTSRKYKAPAKARPGPTEVTGDVIARFVTQHEEAAQRIRKLDARVVSRIIMTSPFVRVITYSVLDGYRLLVAHDWRHFEQARRVTLSAGFPAAQVPEHIDLAARGAV